MKTRNRTALAALSIALALAANSLPAFAEDTPNDNGILTKKMAVEAATVKPSYSIYAARNYPTRPLWGDTHLHTSVSFDGIGFGCTLGPEEAYRFARGEEVTSSTGQRVRLSTPLDFLVVADHAEAMGSMGEVLAGNPTLMTDPDVKRWNEMMTTQGAEGKLAVYNEMVARGSGQGKPPPAVILTKIFAQSVWEKQTAYAEKYNDPGRFSAIIGYEWSSTPQGNNLHRNVIFRDGKAKADQVLPLPAITDYNPESLWKWMQAYEDKTGGQVLAISHNGNLSNGRMFALANFNGEPLTKKYAEDRSRWEPLYEVTQTKGDGESHPFLSPNDEFAAFERWDTGNLGGPEKKTKDMFQFEYARAALKNGLKVENELGANPFKFGMVGSSDAHNGLAAMAEDNFFSKLPHTEPSNHRATDVVLDYGPGKLKVMGWQQNAAGYAAVWANENTRESIWDAMKRRETYATTGSRMTVRLFGGWDFVAKDAQTRMPANVGYAKGVPMGGDLQQAPAGKSPTFLVAALKDPLTGNLDRYQIIKGWLDAKGVVQEKIYDVAWSGTRKPGANGKLPPVGNTVNLATATWTNTIGSPELIAVWKDPDFNPALKAFYYGRVIEIPTPRWTAYDAVRYGIAMTKEVPMTLQERAYTSPIWYTPGT